MSLKGGGKDEGGLFDRSHSTRSSISTISAKMEIPKGDMEKVPPPEQEEHVPYPKHVFFIFGNEFCERFAYYGMRTVLLLYLSMKLGFSEHTAVVIYHTYVAVCYFTPILGAFLSDSYLGKFKTILYVSMVYASGSVLLAVGALDLKADVALSMIALVVIAFGTGGIKPCVSVFGADQFKLPQQAAQLGQYFGIFYCCINLGSFMSTIITPILRSDIQCFGADTCYFASFGIPAILFIVAIAIFVFGYKRYTIYPPTGENLLVKCCQCIWEALRKKRNLKKAGVKKEEWLDYAEDRFGAHFVDDVKAVLNILVLYAPIPIYFALYDRSSSIWTFQAARMNGKLGSVTLKPDQMQAVNAILIVMFIPLFDKIVYPIAAKFNALKSPLHRIGIGGVLLCVAFVISGIVEFSIQKSDPELPAEGKAHLSVINGIGCDATLGISLDDDEDIMKSFTEKTFMEIDPDDDIKITFEVQVASCEGQIQPKEDSTVELTVDPKADKSHSVLLYVSPNTLKLEITQMDDDDKEKNGEGNAKLRIYQNLPKTVQDSYEEIFFECSKRNGDRTFDIKDDTDTAVALDYEPVEPYEFTISLQHDSASDDVIEAKEKPEFEMGGVYNVLVQQMGDENGELHVNVITMTQPNSYHMLLQVPQYVVLTAAEILYSITGLEFSYAEAPKSMKCVLQSCWLVASGIGNVLIIAIESAGHMKNRAYESIMYAGLMIVDVAIFALLASRYKRYESKFDDENELPEKEKPHN